jgi:hypothetical protein
MKPYWLGSIHDIIEDFRSYEMTISSAILHNDDVSDIGCRSLLTSNTILFLGMGQYTFASFHTADSRSSRKDAFNIAVTGSASKSAYDFNTQFGRLSGPLDLPEPIRCKWDNTSSTETTIGVSFSQSCKTCSNFLQVKFSKFSNLPQNKLNEYGFIK